MRIKSNSLFYATMMFTFSSVGLQLMGFIYRIGMSRLIGAEGMGVYGLVMPVYSVVQSFTLSGLTLAVTKESAKYEALQNPAALSSVMRCSLSIYLFQFSLAALPIFLLSKNIAADVLGDTRTRAALLILLPCMCLTGVENLFKAYFQGIHHIAIPIISELGEQIIRIIAVLGLLYLFRGADAGVCAALIVAGMVISEVFSAVFLSCWYTIRKKLRKKRGSQTLFSHEASRAQRGTMLPALLTAALPVSLAGLFNNFLASANTIILPRRLVLSGIGESQALRSFGIMTGMTFPLLMMPAAFIIPITSVLVPKLSQACALGRQEDVRRKAAKGIHATGIISFGAAAILLSLGEGIAKFIYNEPAAGNYMAPLTAAAFFTFYQIVTGSILNGIGHQKLSSLSIVICSIIHIVFTWFTAAIPGIGMAGYVVGDLVSSLFGAAFNIIQIKRFTGLTLRTHNWFIKPLLSFLAAAFTARLVFSGLNALPSYAALLFSGSVCLGIYVLTLRFQGISLKKYMETIKK